MKKILAVLLAAALLCTFAACGKTEPANTNETAQDVGVANPMREVAAEELEFSVNVPEGAADVQYFVIEDGESKMDQVTFTLDGKDYCCRMQQTGEVTAYDMSGIYADSWETEDTAAAYCDAVAKTCAEGSVIFWLDVVPGINYTLSSSQQLTAAELSELATVLFAPMQGDAAADEELPAVTEGHYEDGDSNTVDVEYAGMNSYDITIGLYRLAELEGEGRWEEGSLKFTATAPDGSSIDGRFFPCEDGDCFSLCFTDSQWSLLESGTLFEGFLPAN